MRIAAVALMLIGCGTTSVSTAPGPDGRAAYIIECRDTADCMEEAAEQCPRGYEISGQRETRAGHTAYVPVGRSVVAKHRRGRQEIVVQCR